MNDSRGNEQTAAMLTDYVSMRHPPEFAVLVNGPWGSGKTWFVKSTMEQLKDSTRRVIYVSLFGLGSATDIDDAIFSEIHPLLGSKKGRLLGKVAKSFLKGTLKLDIDDDGKTDGAVNFSLPEFSSSDLSPDHSDTVFIFDDLERCQIDPVTLLGYVNHLVEILKCKVVLIANEKKIARDSTSQKNLTYVEIREKTIGATTTVKPQLDAALASFINAVDDQKAKHLLSRNAVHIGSIYERCKHQNLRHLRHAFFHFERLHVKLNEKIQSHEALMDELLEQFLILCIEYQANALKAGDIKSLPGYVSVGIRLSGDKPLTDEQQRARDLWSKHPDFDINRTLLERSIWTDVIENGTWHEESINQALLNSRYFGSSERAEWVELWHMFELSDQRVEALLNLVIDKLRRREYLELGPLKHVFGELLYLSDAGVMRKSRSAIVSDAKAYIDEVASDGRILNMRQESKRRFNDTGFAGLAYTYGDTDEFEEISNYLSEGIEQAYQLSLPDKANNLLELMKGDCEEFCRKITFPVDGGGEYYDTPILSLVDTKIFVEKFFELSPSAQREVVSSIVARYNHIDAQSELTQEVTWLEDISSSFGQYASKNKGKFSAFRLEIFSENLIGVCGLLRERIPG